MVLVQGCRRGRDFARLLGVGEGVGAAVVGNGDVALLNVNVGRAILAHRPQLHQVAVWLELLRHQNLHTASQHSSACRYRPSTYVDEYLSKSSSTLAAWSAQADCHIGDQGPAWLQP